jgi:hypothetical protein
LDTTIHKNSTNNVNKTWSLLQISGGKDKSNKLTGLLSQTGITILNYCRDVFVDQKIFIKKN